MGIQRTNTTNLSVLIDHFIKEQGLEEGLKQVRIFKAFDILIGVKGSKFVGNKYFKNGILYCNVTSSMFRTNLEFQKCEIISKLNKMLNEEIITDIVLR